MRGDIQIKRALLSVSDKAGLIELGHFLVSAGVEILSTGGSAAALSAAGVRVREVSDYTGFPEILDGRVKTLHPRLHGGLLGRRDAPTHQNAMQMHDIPPIDLAVVNLYPFEATVAAGADFDSCIENIDIGGPALIRSAAKNHAGVTVLVDPADYQALIAEMSAMKGATRLDFRQRMAAKAFQQTASYDAAVAEWFAKQADAIWPERLTLTANRKQILSYGENPHQSAALYIGADKRPGAATAQIVQGKPLSYNNLNDADAAFELAAEFDPAHNIAVAIIKHANPCGVAIGKNAADAYRRALACDPTSAFGGVIALNGTLDAETATAITGIFTEVIIAPDATADARAIVAAKKNLRLLLTGGLPDARAPAQMVRSIAGGFLIQTRDNKTAAPTGFRVVTKRAPTPDELVDLEFAFCVAKHVKSNAIVYARNRATLGVGAGQMSRVDSSRIAAQKAASAGLSLKGAVVASDAFFPFADGLQAAIDVGASAVIQPGGSIRDAEVITAADQANIAMVFTDIRHFRH